MPCKVLIVDDEPDIVDLVEDVLQGNDYACDKATSALDAADKICTTHYELVISDIQMPGQSGLKLLEGLRSSGRQLPPFIFMTGNPKPEYIESAFKLGAACILVKPFSIGEILTVIERTILRCKDPAFDVSKFIQGITGIELTGDKLDLVATKLLRRSLQMGMLSLDEYYIYFLRNRDQEVKEIVAVLVP